MKRIGETKKAPVVAIKDANFPSPFASGLEYSAPARGGWTIVHVGMLVPESHEIFVCAAGCLRGVVLSAAEMNLTGRFSTVAIEEHNVLEGDMEDLLIEGVTDILNRLPIIPKSVQVFSSCIHSFMGCDLEMCYRVLGERFPGVDFVDCYMIPTMRKSGLTPDQIMRRQMYRLLKPVEKSEKHCAIVGNCFSMEKTSDIVRLIEEAGWIIHQITDCKTYEEFQTMAQCSVCISTQSVAKVGGEDLAERLHMKHLYLPAGFNADEINHNLEVLAESLGTSYKGDIETEKRAEETLKAAKAVIKDTPVAIDYTVVSRPVQLARLLVSHGFNVTDLFLDSFSGEEKDDYIWLKENAGDIRVMPTVGASMRIYQREEDEKVLALGQKAAYFTGSPYFVNLIEGGGLYGFDGISRFAEMMIEAFKEEKATERLIQMKGLGCESCL